VQDIERAMEWIDRDQRVEIPPRRPLIEAVFLEVSLHRVEVEARNVPRFEDVTDLVRAPGICAVDLAVAVTILTNEVNRTAAHGFGIA
jgi:hypothetical protein